MSTPLRLLGFAAVLAAVFGLSLAGARTLLPADLARGASTSSSHDTDTQTQGQEIDMDHPTSTEPSEPSHGSGHLPSPAADPVRGLASRRTATS